MIEPIDRRRFFGIAAVTSLAAGIGSRQSQGAEGEPGPAPKRQPSRPLLTPADRFVDVSRGDPKPSTLKGEALVKARLTSDAWRLEVVSDGTSDLARSFRLEDGTALDLAALKALPSVKYLKAMQCNNIPFPLGQGLWEGAPLREVLRLLGRVGNVRRVYYWGFHNDDPAQLFQSSLAFNRALESPPWEPPPIVAYRLNGREIPLERGGPVRMVIPWAHGFKSIKWLQRIVLTNDYKANDTYALQNNDPESYLKTAAYLGKESPTFQADEPVVIEGTAMAGWSGLKRVESWLRPATVATLSEDDPAWKSADWRPCELAEPPDDWTTVLPDRTDAREVFGFDAATGRPMDWPTPFSTVSFVARLGVLPPGRYELRARAVDRNGFAQPEPRPYQKSGMNLVPLLSFGVTK